MLFLTGSHASVADSGMLLLIRRLKLLRLIEGIHSDLVGRIWADDTLVRNSEEIRVQVLDMASS